MRMTFTRGIAESAACDVRKYLWDCGNSFQEQNCKRGGILASSPI